MIPFPDKKYDIIYADPPWKYKENGAGNRTLTANCGYELMDIDEICKLPISNITKENCILFMWVTFPRLEDGLKTIKAWGFQYHSLGFNWVKLNKKSDTPFWGMGFYTRQNAEICLISVKGKRIHPEVRNIHSVILSKVEEHSRKPDIARSGIEKLFPKAEKMELFAREKHEGWDVWGNEVQNQ